AFPKVSSQNSLGSRALGPSPLSVTTRLIELLKVGRAKKHCDLLKPPSTPPLNLVSFSDSPCTDRISSLVSKEHASSFPAPDGRPEFVIAGDSFASGLEDAGAD